MATNTANINGSRDGSAEADAYAPPGFPGFPLIRRLALECQAAYTTDTVKCGRTGAAANVTFCHPNSLTVAFRGSRAPLDFIQDAKFGRKLLMTLPDGREAEVHEGFLEDFESIIADIVHDVRGKIAEYHRGARPENLKIYITGHSLGGALAILCALEFARQGIPITRVVTFGQPRVGNRVFCELYNRTPIINGQDEFQGFLGELTFRVVNENDIVARLPGKLIGYGEVGQQIFFPMLSVYFGDWRLNPSLWFHLASDLIGFGWALRCRRDVLVACHFLDSYLNRLKRITFNQ